MKISIKKYKRPRYNCHCCDQMAHYHIDVRASWLKNYYDFCPACFAKFVDQIKGAFGLEEK